MSRKLDTESTLALAYYFAQGVPVPAVAAATGISTKSVRLRYLTLRDLLLKPDFNKWHGLHKTLVDIPEIENELWLRGSFLKALNLCYANKKCFRNHAEGGRKNRLCRACPLPHLFQKEGRVEEALGLIDATRDFYERLHIRGERALDPTLLFAKRLVHTVTVTTAIAHSRKLENGLFDPTETKPLSVATLTFALME